MQNIFNNHWQRQQNVDLQKEGEEEEPAKNKKTNRSTKNELKQTEN